MDPLESLKLATRQQPLDGKYSIMTKLTKGGFGTIYIGSDQQDHMKVVIKIEEAKQGLQKEYEFYNLLEGALGIPRCIWCGPVPNSEDTALVMDCMGSHLNSIFKKCKKNFSLKTILIIGLQLITILEAVHQRNIIHRDVKPANIVIGKGSKASQLYLIDFGLSEYYRNPNTGEHIKQEEDITPHGTPYYCSANHCLGTTASRRDDLESAAYILLRFLNHGYTPWEFHKHGDWQKTGLLKRSRMPSSLFVGHSPAFAQYLMYCRNPEFTQEPDYEYLRELFQEEFQKNGFTMEGFSFENLKQL